MMMQNDVFDSFAELEDLRSHCLLANCFREARGGFRVKQQTKNPGKASG
jgi:hypothetical protein